MLASLPFEIEGFRRIHVIAARCPADCLFCSVKFSFGIIFSEALDVSEFCQYSTLANNALQATSVGRFSFAHKGSGLVKPSIRRA